MKNEQSMDIVCPFYKFESGKTHIHCEGIVWTRLITLKFFGSRQKIKHMSIFCCDKYKHCEIYSCIMGSKYPDEAEEN